MARFVDLEDDEDAPMPGEMELQLAQQQRLLKALKEAEMKTGSSTLSPSLPFREHQTNPLPYTQTRFSNGRDKMEMTPGSNDIVDANETFMNYMTEAFQCYPIASAIVSNMDLNTLDSLARTCRMIHHGLVQYRNVLVSSSLHCVNEETPVDPEETFRFRARAGNWYYAEDGRGYNGKMGDCARDMVSGCRRCGEIICRNCTIKPPASVTLRERHRRLCKACSRAPIATLAKPPLDPDLPISSEAVQHAMCKCDTEGVWLCQPCGRSIRSADHEYKRIWRWRASYGEVLGGLGTGIGDGDRGVICGREQDCCAAKERAQQTDCDAEDARDGTSPDASPYMTPSGDFNTDPMAQLNGRQQNSSLQLGPGYNRHEVEGIGGIVKRTRVSMVRIGACVPEYEIRLGNNRGSILERETTGAARSWCGWCWRVIPSKKDWEGCYDSSSDGG